MTGIEPARLREVADGVFAYLQPNGGWGLNNAGVVTGGGTTLVVDTAATEARAHALRAAVARVSRRPARIVVNTHHHGDHTHGNFVFAPDAVVMAHDAARDEIVSRGLAMTQVWPEVDWGRLRPHPPELTFGDRIRIRLGERAVELIHVGPGHTTNDVIVWLPDDGVLFAGDLVVPGCTPYVQMGSLRGSLAALDVMAELGPRVIVGGHGPVAGPRAIEDTRAYLRWVRELATSGQQAGRSPLETALGAGAGDFRDLVDPERLVANLHRAYAED